MDSKHLSVWRAWSLVLLVAVFSVCTYGVALLKQSIDDVKSVSVNTAKVVEQNDRFVDNFSNYMTCLIIGEDEVVKAVGEEAYVEICKQLLYRGITPVPPTIKAEVPRPPTTITPSTTG